MADLGVCFTHEHIATITLLLERACSPLAGEKAALHVVGLWAAGRIQRGGPHPWGRRLRRQRGQAGRGFRPSKALYCGLKTQGKSCIRWATISPWTLLASAWLVIKVVKATSVSLMAPDCSAFGLWKFWSCSVTPFLPHSF